MARGVYKGGQVNIIDIPSLSSADLKTQASGFSNLNTKIEEVLSFSLQEGAVAAKQKAQEFVASNPLMFADIGSLSAEEKQKYFGDQGTVFGQEVKVLQSGLLATDAKNSGKILIENLERQYLINFANTGEIDLAKFNEDVSSIVNGTAEALAGIDVDEAIAVKNSLGIAAKSSFESIANKQIEKIQLERKLNAESAAEVTLENIRLLVEANGANMTYIDEASGEERVANTLNVASEMIDDQFKSLVAAGSETADEFLANANQKYHQSSQTYIEKYFKEQTVLSENSEAFYEDVVNGTFGGDMNRATLYTSLPQSYKDKVLSNLNNWFDGLVKAEDDLAKSRGFLAQDNKTNITVSYYGSYAIPGEEGEQQRADALQAAQAYAAIDEGALFKELTEDTITKNLDVVTIPSVLTDLEEELYAGTLQYNEILRETGVRISHEDASKLKVDLFTLQKLRIDKVLDGIAARMDWVTGKEEAAQRLQGITNDDLKLQAIEKDNKINKIRAAVNEYAVTLISEEVEGIEVQRRPTIKEIEDFAKSYESNYDNVVREEITQLKGSLQSMGVIGQLFLDQANKYHKDLGDLTVRDGNGDLVEFQIGNSSKYFLNDEDSAERLILLINNLIKQGPNNTNITTEDLKKMRADAITLSQKYKLQGNN